eukprot:3875399-Alexandrium_andersonii.AAC.1
MPFVTSCYFSGRRRCGMAHGTRHRVPPPLEHLRPPSVSAALVGAASVAATAWLMCLVAVSYTHLRAHETSAHL